MLPIPDIFEFTQVHMGLPVRIVLHAADEQAARRAAAAAFDRIATLDRMMSDYRPDSDVRRIALRAGQAVPVSRELLAVVQQAVEIARLTDGAFDPTIAPLVGLWRDARRTGRPPDPSALAVARSKVAWHRIELNPARSTIRLPLPGMALDLGGIAKGYILQEALRTLRRLGVTRVLLESGGDIVVGDAPPDRPGWAIEAAGADSAFVQRASRLANVAIASSGATAQFVEIDGVRYSHVIDPRTGLGVTSPRTARVIAEDAATADGLATALTVLESAAAAAVLKRFPGVMVSMVQGELPELPKMPELPKLPKLPAHKMAAATLTIAARLSTP